GVDDLVSHLQARGYSADGLHGDLKQQMRDRVMGKFRTGKLEILVATDVAARGIDVDDIDAVFNYDMPQDDEYYVHRIGRTARAGRKGQAFTFVVGREFRAIKEIERYTKTKITSIPIPSIKDVEEVRTNSLVEQIKETMDKEENLEKYIKIVERLIGEEYTSLDVAGGLLKMVIGSTMEGDKIDENYVKSDNDYSGGGSGRDSRDGKRGKDKRRDSDRGKERGKGKGDFKRNEDMSRLFINIGKNQRVEPKDIVGAIAGESGIPGRSIGEIAIFDKYSFVEIPKKLAEKVVNAMNKNTIKGKVVAVEVANDRQT
ncbi:MAG: DbpA RNA binding domain-containing protein, partial [bacterium]